MIASLSAGLLVLSIQCVNEPEPNGPAERDPVFEPVQITPPPERPQLGPAVEPAVEPWDIVMQPPPLPPPPPPPDGAGRLVGGSVALGLGFAAASAVIVEATLVDGNPRGVASTFVPLGLASAGVGIYLLVRGARARANFNEWRAYTNARSRPTGNGLLVGGTMSLAIGGITVVAAAVSAREPGAFERPLTPTLFGIGAAGVGFGIAAVTWGMTRRDHYRRWRQSTFLATFLGVVPTVAPTRSGVSLGVAGRF
jgi:hypothetical protein